MLGMMLAHFGAIVLGVCANKFIGSSVVGALNILFTIEIVLYAGLQMFEKITLNSKDNDGFFYSGIAIFSLIIMNIICLFYR